MIDIVLHLAVLLILPPLLLGIINKTKAFFAGRKGPPLLQVYYDIGKLLRKDLALSGTTGWVFRAGPVVTLVATAFAGLLLPFGGGRAPLAFAGDMILFAYLFGLARFFTTAAALDTGSAFEGMGSAREAGFACLSEPALLFVFLSLTKLSGSLCLSSMLGSAWGLGAIGISASAAGPLILASAGLFIVLLAESCRIPVDDPTTHLELTMIHEAMVLDHSGPLFGLVEYSASMKLLVLESLFVAVAIPIAPEGELSAWGLYALGLVATSVAIGVVESIMARLRMRRVSYLLTGALLLCGSGFILLVR